MIIFSNNLDDHIKHVDEMLTTLTDDGITLKINKCHFLQIKHEYLGRIVKTDRIEIDKTNVAPHREAHPYIKHN